MENGFGDYLRELRGKMSLREAAEESGISHTYIRDLELGNKIDPSQDTLTKLARAYGITWGDLSSKKHQYIDYPRLFEETGGAHKTPLETMGYFRVADGEGYVLKEFLEEISILINDYNLQVTVHEYGKILYQEFLTSVGELADKLVNEIRLKLESIIFEGFRNKADLINILKEEETTYKGVHFSEDDINRILYTLESIINKESESSNELVNFLQKPFINYKNLPLTEDESQRILDMLKLIFPDRQ
jgi:transcriptional regulator with XRE-family HTH domain